MTRPIEIPEHLADYRKVLVAASQKTQEELDKSILSLSGGGLGVSLVFIKDIVGPSSINWPWVLMAAWTSWGLSIVAVLVSYHLSIRAVRDGIAQIDSGTSVSGRFGGKAASATAWLNRIGIVLFFVGVIGISTFACINISLRGTQLGQPSAAASAASSSGRSGVDTRPVSTIGSPAASAGR